MPSRLFSIEMLPADHGDCLLLTYGSPRAPRRVLIDGGTARTFPRLRERLKKLPPGQREFELLIVTHIDSDHIDGVLPLLRAKDLGVTFKDIWFNGWRHLVPPRSELLGPRQGDMLGNLLSMRTDLRWNGLFGGRTVVVPDAGDLPVHTLAGGLRLTLLSPTWTELAALDAAWIRESFTQGRIPGEAPQTLRSWSARLRELSMKPFVADHSAANGSSIAVLAEYQGRRCLLTGDAFADTLLASLKRLPDVKRRLKLDAFKLPHHASKANVTEELIQAVDCPRYLVSTNGSVFGHPDDDALKQVFLHAGRTLELCFNYDSETTRKWNQATPLPRTPVKRYRPRYPSSPEGGLIIDLL